MHEPLLHFNGVDEDTGGLARPPLAVAELGRLFAGGGVDPARAEDLRDRLAAFGREHLGPKHGVDERDLAQAGWGVILPPDLDPEVRLALAPLLELRREQASAIAEARYREIVFQPGWSRWQFLEHHEADDGPVDPDRIPYYLLIVGEPEAVPFELQYDLDLEHAVGRVAFARPQDYAAWAAAVVAAERGEVEARPAAACWAVRNPGDTATCQSHDLLVEPLAELLDAKLPTSWALERHLAETATKDALTGLLGGRQPPSLLVSACHGLEVGSDPERQRRRQGAFVCQDWPGPAATAGLGLAPEHCFAAEDLATSARLDGLVVFHYGCYGAGTPATSSFEATRPRLCPPSDFVAELPRRLLAQGAAAVISHVDQVWAFSYLGLRGGERRTTFESLFERLLDGYPVGSALEGLNRRAANREVEYTREERAFRLHGKKVDAAMLADLRISAVDARTWVVLGDPAARLPHLGSPSPPAGGAGT